MAEQSGMAPEQLRKLEEQAAESGMRTMWKGVKLEVESVVRETAERVLSEPGVPKAKLEMRAAALELMAEVCLYWSGGLSVMLITGVPIDKERRRGG